MERLIRVLIVDDSPVARQVLEGVIEGAPGLEVAGLAADAAEAMVQIRRLRPDVVTMDIRLPGMSGIEATRRIMQEMPLPVVVVADDVSPSAIEALRAGALAVVEKPPSFHSPGFAAAAEHLCTQLTIMSQVRVIRQRPLSQLQAWRAVAPVRPHRGLVAIVTSTGGPGALARLLPALPSHGMPPLVVVQHIGASFVAGFTAWLGGLSPLPVVQAGDGDVPRPGHVYVAPGDSHLILGGDRRLHTNQRPPVGGLRPAGDVLLDSVADVCASDAVGVVLTGMGEDGARGLLALRRRGGHTIAESRDSAVIWGMPGAAVALGAAVEELPLDAIAARLALLAGRVEERCG